MPRFRATGVVLVGIAVLAGCGAMPEPGRAAAQAAEPKAASAAPRPMPVPSPARAGTDASPAPSPTTPARPARSPEALPLASDGRPRPARLTIPALDLVDLRVRPHEGTPDDAQGTRIQDAGSLASPFGTGGLVGPGGIGNHLITGHRMSSTKPFADLPRLRKGARVHVETKDHRYTYRIVETRITSFRSPRSLREQSAAVPGRPNARPERAMITLSTCRTPEDHAEGNFWSDEFGNPEHRIDKVGVLVAVTPVRP
ncbi:MAG: class E sortase [Candidatus Nanopelagicales bacterium]|nr:class E sortase [Candidatus Nanopelagicales bacterium]